MPPPSPADAVLDCLRRHQGEMAGLLAELARLESPSVVPASQGPVLDRLGGELRALGMRVRRLRGKTSGGHLFAAPPRQAAGRLPAQLLLGHCDTVWPLGMLATMPVETRGGRLYGPGVYDMKAGLVQAVFALRALRELQLEPPAAPLLFVNSDEETGSGDSTRWVRLLAGRVRRVFVLEPSLGPEGMLKTGRKGVGQFVVTVRGRAAHAGLEPERGASAVLELSHVIQRLHALADPARGIAINVGVVSGGLRGNVVPPEARAEVDVRVLREEDAPALEAAIRGLAPTLPGTRLEVTGAIDRPPLIETPANLALRRTAEAAARQLGLVLGHGTAGGASDGNTTSRTTATLDGLGAVGGGAHAIDEHVELARMPERAALLALLLLAPVAAAAASGESGEPASEERVARAEGAGGERRRAGWPGRRRAAEEGSVRRRATPHPAAVAALAAALLAAAALPAASGAGEPAANAPPGAAAVPAGAPPGTSPGTTPPTVIAITPEPPQPPQSHAPPAAAARAAGARSGRGARAAGPPLSPAEVKAAQRRLAELGYWAGSVTGPWDATWRHALIAFQKVEWRKPTGVLTRAEWVEMARAAPPTPRETGPAHIEVDLARQVFFMVDDAGVVSHILPISTGSGRPFRAPGWQGVAETPCGHFTVFSRGSGWHKSQLGEMYNPLYLVGGIAIHGSLDVPPKPVSHGCIRIPMYAAKRLPKLVPREMPVVVYGCKDEGPPAAVPAKRSPG